MVIGKNAKVYILNPDNLGGTNAVLQTIVATNSIFGGPGSYPPEGGHFFLHQFRDGTYAYKSGTDVNGVPVFAQAGKTLVNSAGRVGVGRPTITSYNGQQGTAIVSFPFRVEY